MTHYMLTKNQIGNLYQNRRKFNQAVGQLFGDHLHDISEQQSDKSNNSINKNSPINGNGNVNNYGLGVNSQNTFNLGSAKVLNSSPSGSAVRKNQKFDDFFTNINNENRMQKLYKQNIELQKKVMNIKQQNQLFKHKSNLWQKMKQYILTNINQEYKLKSIKFSSSDVAILQQFLIILDQIMQKNRNNQKNKVIGGEKDHIICRQMHDDIKRKFQQQCKKVSTLMLEMQVMKNQNRALSMKDIQYKSQRRAKITQLQQGIQQKFHEIELSLIQKTQQNAQLQSKILKLQSQIFQLRNNNSPLFRNKGKSASTSTNTHAHSYEETTVASVNNVDRNQLEGYKRVAKSRQQQIQSLKRQGKFLQSQVSQLRSSNNKMKKVIKLAQNLNDQFLIAIEQSISKNKTAGYSNSNNQYDSGYNDYKMSPISSVLPVQRNLEVVQNFHMVNKRFKIVKSQSVGKQKFTYGKTNKF